MKRAAIVFVAYAILASGQTSADAVLIWNRVMLDAIRADSLPPTLASRNLAILNLAIHDAVNSIERTHQEYRFLIDPMGPASTTAAVYGAGHVVMALLFPQLRSTADLVYVRFTQAGPLGESEVNGIDLGRLVGLLAVDSRSDDGASTSTPYIPSYQSGQWRRTPPHFRPPLDPNWRYVQPFGIDDLERFVVPPPPALTSRQYAEELNQVAMLGVADNSLRTSEQSEVALFWSDFSYTATPPGHWIEIAADIATREKSSTPENARLFALLSLSLADAGIVTWEGKYRYNLWRPITAIQRANEDNNPQTVQNSGWSSFLVTPPFPEYPSGHSTFSRASAVALEEFFGTDTIPVIAVSDSVPGIERHFESLSSCADEIGMSRIYGGIHFMNANVNGKTSGAAIARFIGRNFLLPNQSLPKLVWERRSLGALQLRVHGRIGRLCVVELSEDLRSWTSFASNTAVPGGFAAALPATDTANALFFRVLEQ